MKQTLHENEKASEDNEPSLQEKGSVDGAASSRRNSLDNVILDLHPVPPKDALIVKIQPPVKPPTEISHVPCDIVLVIDVSGSMRSAAPVPGEDSTESTGLSVLDLVKHAAMTIIETMDETDRLAIVTFGSLSNIVQPLIPMTEKNKQTSRENVRSMYARDATNLWQGILNGIKVFEETQMGTAVPAIMVLTDGMPNHMCPYQGYVPKMRTMLPFPASIHTFGFGYELRSGLLKSIAEIGSGNYAFIPDAGMIGTVFVHAVANLQATYATEAVLRLTCNAPLEIEQTMGDSVDKQKPEISNGGMDSFKLDIPLGNLQFGQSRDIFLKVNNLELTALGYIDEADPVIGASLSFRKMVDEPTDPYSITKKPGFLSISAKLVKRQPTSTVSTHRNVLDVSDLPDAEIAYHESRARICNYLSSLFPMATDGEHKAIKGDLEAKQTELADLIANLPAKQYPDDPLNNSLIQDLTGDEPQGQVSLAVNNTVYFRKWGVHYLPSLLNAHTRQTCNSFKDPGPLCYGANSPLFIACRDRLDAAFDKLPPPPPTVVRARVHAGSGRREARVTSMSRYNRSRGPCFAGSAPVEVASGRTIAIRKLRRGVKVRTPAGVRKVAMVLKTPVQEATLCRVGELLVTPWHPVSVDGEWVFPAHVAEKTVRYTGAVYSVLLQQDQSTEAHALRVGGIWGVTLGHGMLSGDDVRAHDFLGDYRAVGKSLVRLGPARNGVVMGGGVERDPTTGTVCGFKRLGARPNPVANAVNQVTSYILQRKAIENTDEWRGLV